MGKKNRVSKTEPQSNSCISNSCISNSNSSNSCISNSSNSNSDLFDNPMTRSAMAALSEEDKVKYKIIGDHLYGRINFENGQTLNNMPPPMAEAVAYVETSLMSGMHPSMLEENEKALLKDNYGDEWYKRWGYVQEDLNDIVTLTLDIYKNS
jgi:hypothetical protein